MYAVKPAHDVCGKGQRGEGEEGEEKKSPPPLLPPAPGAWDRHMQHVHGSDPSYLPAQADIKAMLKVKESGLGDAWKRIMGTLQESLGCTSKCLLPFLHAALRLAVERRYILLSDRYVLSVSYQLHISYISVERCYILSSDRYEDRV